MTVTTATGVIQQFLRPPLGLTTIEFIPPGSFTAAVTLSRVRGPIQVDAYGIRVLVSSAPVGYGFVDEAAGRQYDRAMWSMGIFTENLSGQTQNTQPVSSKSALTYIFFEESFPHHINLEPSPGVVLDAWWILRLGVS